MKINTLGSLMSILFLIGCSSISTPTSTPKQIEPASTNPINAVQATDLSVILLTPTPTSTIRAESPVPDITTTSIDNQTILKGFGNTIIRWLYWLKNGKILLIGTQDNGITVYDIEVNKAIVNFENGSTIQEIALSRDESTLAVVISNDNSIRLLNPKTGSIIRTLPIPFSWPQGLAFSPDNKVLASGNDRDKEITLWEVATGREVKRLNEGDYSIRKLSFSPDGKSLMANCIDNQVRIWNTDTWNLQRTFQGDYYFFTFSPDGRYFATSGTEIQDPAVWDFNSESKQFNLSDGQPQITSIAYDPNGKFIAVGNSNGGNMTKVNTITIYDAYTGKQLRKLVVGYYATSIAMEFSPDGTKLAYVAQDENSGEVIIWDLNQP